MYLRRKTTFFKTRGRMLAAPALLVLACSSSSKTVGTDPCSPGEVTQCQHASGCNALKACKPIDRTYGPCQCVLDGGSTGGSSGLGGRGGGTGASAGRGGTGPTGGSAGVPPGGSAGTQGGIGGAGGGPPPPDGSPGTGGSGGAAGAPPADAGPGGRGGRGGTGPVDAGPTDAGMACLRCSEALMQGASPNDPRICQASRSFFTQAYNCICVSSTCSAYCAQRCLDSGAYPMTQACQDCLVSNCPGIASACQTG